MIRRNEVANSSINNVREGMEVIASDGGMVGRVFGLHADHIHVQPTAPVHGGDHIIPRGWIARVDEHVHLDRDAALVRETWGSDHAIPPAAGHAGRTSGAAAAGAGGAHAAAHGGMGKSWIVWLIGAILLLGVIVLGVRGCGYASQDANYEDNAKGELSEADRAASGVSAADAGSAGVAGAGGAGANLNSEVQAYLASSEAAPRTFTFQNLNFDTSSAEIRDEYRDEIEQIGRTLAGSQNARIRIVGYADARGAEGANADLGKRRAEAVAAALTANGLGADRIETQSGGEADPRATNQNAQGQAENRRTELVVLSR